MRGRVLLLAAVLPLAACADSLARRDTVTAYAPDTQRQVIAAQAINPWPRKAYDKTWSTDGEAALLAWKRRLSGNAAAAPAASSTGAGG